MECLTRDVETLDLIDIVRPCQYLTSFVSCQQALTLTYADHTNQEYCERHLVVGGPKEGSLNCIQGKDQTLYKRGR